MGLFLLATQTPAREVIVAVVLALSCAASVALGHWAQAEWHNEDPRPFVLDEFAGYLVAVLFLGQGGIVWKAVLAFAAFRFFDVVKPFPARRLERLPAGWGILLDDIVAGVYANIAVRVAVVLLGAKGIV